MKKLFCLAVLSCFSLVGCGPSAPAGNIKPAVDAPTDGAAVAPMTPETAVEAPKESAPVTEAPK